MSNNQDRHAQPEQQNPSRNPQQPNRPQTDRPKNPQNPQNRKQADMDYDSRDRY